MIGRTLNHYQVVGILGAGGMGEVYLAEDTSLGRRVALKILSADVTADPARLARFEQEARAASALNHPNVLTIHEVGESQGLRYIATEYIDGETLRRRLLEPIRLSEILDISIAVANALAAAHEAGVVHRDIKPENVMIRRDGLVKVLDFGLARPADGDGDTTERLTEPGSVVGTVHYMSPEQARGKPLDGRSDLFSFGVVLFEMLTGVLPFTGPSRSDVLASILRSPTPDLTELCRGVPVELQNVVRRLLEKNRDERCQSARQLAVDLEKIRQSLRSRTLSTAVREETTSDARTAILRHDAPKGHSSVERLFTHLRRNRLPVVGSLIGLLAVLIGLNLGNRQGPIESIAVLPFANASGDPNAEYLSEGLTESLIQDLSRIPKLKVMARSTVFQYKNRMVDPKTVRAELGVEAVLTGRVLHRGGRLVVEADLVDTEAGTQLWGEQYDRSLSDVLAVQEDISREITTNLRLRLTGEEKRRAAKRFTEDSEAFQDYLRGRYAWNRRTEDGLQRAVEHFERAIEKDPRYALAWAGLADCYNLLPVYRGTPTAVSIPKARAAAERALEIDGDLAEAHTSLAYLKFTFDWDWTGAERLYRRAIELNPNYATAHQWYALFLASRGRSGEAIAEMKKAQELDPLSLIINTSVGTVYYLAGATDRAIAQFRSTLEIDPDFLRARYELGRALEVAGQPDAAIPELQRVAKLQDPGITASLARCHARAGRREHAEALLAQLIAEPHTSPYDIAAVHEALGNDEEIFRWLEKAYEVRTSRLAYLAVEPMFRRVHGDARYQSLVARITVH